METTLKIIAHDAGYTRKCIRCICVKSSLLVVMCEDEGVELRDARPLTKRLTLASLPENTFLPCLRENSEFLPSMRNSHTANLQKSC